MKTRSLLAAFVLSFLICGTAMGFSPGEVEESAQHGLKQILDLWRMEYYEKLYTRLTHPPEQGWDYFASRIVYASRIPACCWEQLREVKTTAIGMDSVVVSAKVGLEVEGVGTRFETRNFQMEMYIHKLAASAALKPESRSIESPPRKRERLSLC